MEYQSKGRGSGKSLSCFVILGAFFSSCNRPINCMTKPCKTTTQSTVTTEETGATVTPPPPAAPPSNAIDAMARDVKAMKDRETMLQQIDGVIQRLNSIIEDSIAKIEAQDSVLDRARLEIDEKRQGERRNAGDLALVRKTEYEKTITTLESVSQQISAQKFQIITGIEMIESVILDPLTPEGVKTQIEMDQKLNELDQARAQSDKAAVEKIRGELKQYVNTLLVADKSVLLSLVDQLGNLSQSLIDTHAPSQLVILIGQMLALENKISATSTVEKAETIEKYKASLETIRKAMKAPLSTLTPWQIEGLTKIETGYQTALQTATTLDKYISFIDAAGKTVGEKLGELKTKVQENRSQLEKLKSTKLELEANMAFVTPSLGALSGVYEKLQTSIDQLNIAVTTTLTEQLKPTATGPDPKSVDSFVSAQAELTKGFESIKDAQTSLAAIFASKTACSIGQPVKGAALPLKEISCAGKKMVVAYP